MNAPSNTAAVAVSDSRIDVSWQDNSTKETGFEVHRSSSGPGGTFTLRAVRAANVVSFTDAGTLVDPSTPYCYSVRAVRTAPSGTTYSGFSNPACAAAGDLVVAAVTDGSYLDPDGYTVTLDATTPSGTVPVASIGVAVNGRVVFSGLRAGNYYRVTLADVIWNCGLNSRNPQPVSVISGTTAAVGFELTCATLTAPVAPLLWSATGYFSNSILLTWEDTANNEDGFKVEGCEGVTCSDVDFTLFGTAGPDEESMWVAAAPVQGFYYSFRVRAFNRAGNSEPSNVVVGRPCLEGVEYEAPCF